jgi:hypothetical protein
LPRAPLTAGSASSAAVKLACRQISKRLRVTSMVEPSESVWVPGEPELPRSSVVMVIVSVARKPGSLR